MTRRRDTVCLACLTVLLLAPFLSRPLNIDDPLFVWTARHIAAGHPVDFYGFRLNWYGVVSPMAQVMENPPGVAYLLAAVGRVAGWGEVGLHAALLPAAVAAVVGVHRLAAPLCRRPWAAPLLCLLCPGFLVPATTLMSDVPMFCLWVWAVVAWRRGDAAPRHGGWSYAASGVLISAACLTKYPGVNLVPLLALHAVLFPAPRWSTRLTQAAALAVPVCVLFAYDRVTAALYGHGLLAGAAGFAAGAHAGTAALPRLARWADTLAFTGGAALPAAAVAGVACVIDPVGRWWRAVPVALAWPAAAAAAAGLVPHTGLWAPQAAEIAAAAGLPSPAHALPTGLFDVEFGGLAALGVAVVVLCVDDVARSAAGRDRRNACFLAAWVLGVLAFAGGVNWAINARTLLPLLPPACLLACRAADRIPRRAGRLPPGVPVATAALAAAAVALAVTVADDALARVDRRAALDVLAWRAAAAPGRRLWFQGHWGFQYYLQAAGVTCVDLDAPDLRPGDLLAVPIDNYGVGGTRRRLTVAHVLRYDASRFVATMNAAMAAGFYGSAGDALPFAVGLVPPEPFVVLRVEDGGVVTPVGRR